MNLPKFPFLILLVLFIVITGCASLPSFKPKSPLGTFEEKEKGEIRYVATYPFKQRGEITGYLHIILKPEIYNVFKHTLSLQLAETAHLLAEILDSQINEINEKTIQNLINQLKKSVPHGKIRIVNTSYEIIASSRKREKGKNLFGKKKFPRRPKNIFDRATNYLSEFETKEGKKLFVFTQFLNNSYQQPVGFIEISFPLETYFSTLENQKRILTNQLEESCYTLAKFLHTILLPLNLNQDLSKIQRIFENLSWEMEGNHTLELIDTNLEIIASTDVSKIGTKVTNLKKFQKIHTQSRKIKAEKLKIKGKEEHPYLSEPLQNQLKLNGEILIKLINENWERMNKIAKIGEVSPLIKEISKIENVKEITITDGQGKIIYSNYKNKIGKSPVNLKIKEILNGEKESSSNLSKEVYTLITAIKDSRGKVKGLIYTKLGIEQEKSILNILNKMIEKIIEKIAVISQQIDLEELINSLTEVQEIEKIRIISPDSIIVFSTEEKEIGEKLEQILSLSSFNFPLEQNNKFIATININLKTKPYVSISEKEKKIYSTQKELTLSFLKEALNSNILNVMKIQGKIDLERIVKELKEERGENLQITIVEGKINLSYKEEEEKFTEDETFEFLGLNDYLKQSKEEKRLKYIKEGSFAFHRLLKYYLKTSEEIKVKLDIQYLMENLLRIKGVEGIRLIDQHYKVIASTSLSEIGMEIKEKKQMAKILREKKMKISFHKYEGEKIILVQSPLKEEKNYRGILEIALFLDKN